MMILMPLIRMTLMSFIFPSSTNVMNNIPAATVNNDRGVQGSHSLGNLTKINAENWWMTFKNASSFDEAKDMIIRGEASGAIIARAMLRYLLGSITWLRVVKTDPSGVVVASEETEFEIISDPVNATIGNSAYYFSDSDYDDFSEKDLSLNDDEWARLNSLLEIGLFKNLSEAITFLVREGIKSRSDVFQKTESVMEQLKELKKDVAKNS